MERCSAEARPTRSRWRAVLGAKVLTWLGLAAGICVPYFGLQVLELFPARSLPATGIDRWVAFDPRWIHVYASIALLVPLGPLLAGSRDDLKRYAAGLALLCGACFAIFLLWPVAGPRPHDAVQVPGLYAAIVGVDRPTNSLPSLHAGLALYSVLYIQRMAAEMGSIAFQRFVAIVGVVWVSLILYSTLATAQHWLLDLPPGLALAWVADRWAWRDAR